MAGNSNSGQRKDRAFRDAINAELRRLDGDEPQGTLRKIARRLIRDAISSDRLDAVKELADRIDGRPAQQVDVGMTPAPGDDAQVIEGSVLPLIMLPFGRPVPNGNGNGSGNGHVH